MKKFEFEDKGGFVPLHGEPGMCPYCDSIVIEYEGSEIDETGVTYKVECTECNGKWIETYEVQFSDNWGFPIKE